MEIWKRSIATRKWDEVRANITKDKDLFQKCMEHAIFYQNHSYAPEELIEYAIDAVPKEWLYMRNTGVPMLVSASIFNRPFIVLLLLKKGVDPNEALEHSKTAAEVANSVELLELLVTAGASLAGRMVTLKSPLENMLGFNGKLPLVAYLLARQSNPYAIYRAPLTIQPEYHPILMRAIFLPILLSAIYVPRVGSRSSLRVLNDVVVRLLGTFLFARIVIPPPEGAVYPVPHTYA